MIKSAVISGTPKLAGQLFNSQIGKNFGVKNIFSENNAETISRLAKKVEKLTSENKALEEKMKENKGKEKRKNSLFD